MFRLTDALCTVNNNQFENTYNDIYLNELRLELQLRKMKTVLNLFFGSFDGIAYDGKFITNLFNKKVKLILSYIEYLLILICLYWDVSSS